MSSHIGAIQHLASVQDSLSTRQVMIVLSTNLRELPWVARQLPFEVPTNAAQAPPGVSGSLHRHVEYRFATGVDLVS